MAEIYKVNPISADEYIISDPNDFLSSSPGSDKRFVFLFYRSSNSEPDIYRFILNPQQYDYNLPARVNAIQTKSGIFIDDFGLGLGNIQIKGQTKVYDREENKIVALKMFKELEERIYMAFFKDQIPGNKPKYKLEFINLTDDHIFEVIPTIFSLNKDAKRPFIYNYTMSFYLIEDLHNPRSYTTTDSLTTKISNFMSSNNINSVAGSLVHNFG